MNALFFLIWSTTGSRPTCDSTVLDKGQTQTLFYGGSRLTGLNIPEDSIFMTLDIISLYTNIPLEPAHIVIENILDNRNTDSPLAPSVANLYMSNFENTFILDANVNPFCESIIVFKHFIDDCLVIL